jgi:hypothetical protein
VTWLREADWIIERDADEAWRHFRGWRVNYETAAYALALFLDLPPALWSGERRDGRRHAQPPRRPAHRIPGQRPGLRETRDGTADSPGAGSA